MACAARGSCATGRLIGGLHRTIAGSHTASRLAARATRALPGAGAACCLVRRLRGAVAGPGASQAPVERPPDPGAEGLVFPVLEAELVDLAGEVFEQREGGPGLAGRAHSRSSTAEISD